MLRQWYNSLLACILQGELSSLTTSLSSATGLRHVELRGNTGITGTLADDDLCTLVQVGLCHSKHADAEQIALGHGLAVNANPEPCL